MRTARLSAEGRLLRLWICSLGVTKVRRAVGSVRRSGNAEERARRVDKRASSSECWTSAIMSESVAAICLGDDLIDGDIQTKLSYFILNSSSPSCLFQTKKSREPII